MSWNAISKRLRAAVSICSLLLVGLLATMQWAAQQERKHITITSQVLFPAALYSQVAASSFQRMTREAADGVIMQDKASLSGADADAGLVFSSLRTVQGLMAFRGKRWQEVGTLIDRLADLRLRSNKVYSASLADLENLSPDTLSQWAILARETKEAQANLDGLQVNIQNDFRAELEIIRRISWLQEFIGGAILLVVLATAFFGTRAFIEMAAQKRANEAMREAHKQNEVVLNSVPSLLIELGPDGDIRRWNRSATTILGWDEKVVRGQPLSSCGIDWLTPGMQEKVAACLQSPAENALGEARFKKDGETRFLGLNAVRLKDKAGESVGTLVVGADITKRTILEGQLRQAQKLEAIGQLAAGIAHEINTPTQYVGDNANFLKESWPAIASLARAAQHVQQEFQKGDIPAEAMDHLSACIREADLDYLLDEIPKAIDQAIEGMQRVAKIVHAMKEFSHPGSEGKSSLDINRAIETTVAVARNEWKYVCDVETQLDGDLPLVAGHGPEFNQVILNLLVNAAHAIRAVVGSSPERKGKITITTAHDQSEVETPSPIVEAASPKKFSRASLNPSSLPSRLARELARAWRSRTQRSSGGTADGCGSRPSKAREQLSISGCPSPAWQSPCEGRADSPANTANRVGTPAVARSAPWLRPTTKQARPRPR